MMFVHALFVHQVSPQIQEEVTDTLREVKLRRLLKQAALKSKNQTKTGLQQEGENAREREKEKKRERRSERHRQRERER